MSQYTKLKKKPRCEYIEDQSFECILVFGNFAQIMSMMSG